MSSLHGEPNESCFPHWPGDWPGRQFVNLDCVGDPGHWLDLNLPSVEEVLLQDPKEDESMAVLKIRCEDKFIAVPAKGEAWVQQYSIPAAALKLLPKRLTMPDIEVSIWENALCLARRRFNGVIGIPYGREHLKHFRE